MQIQHIEPYVVVVAFSQADLRLLAEGFEPETFLEPNGDDARFEHALATQATFQALAYGLEQQARVIDLSIRKPIQADQKGDTDAGDVSLLAGKLPEASDDRDA